MAEKKSALIVANSQYEDPILRQLVAPAQDAEALAQVLRNPAISGFEVQTILNAPRHKLEEEIEAFFGDCDRDDLLLLYFSGHGVTDEDGLLYYAACNTNLKRLRSTAVAASFVNDSMTRCRSRRQVLLLDCCHSGAFARTKAAPAVNAGQHFGGRTPEEGRGRFVLTASDAYQYSFEGDAVEGQAVYSVFTQALVQGLRTGEADLDGDGLITLDELYQYVYRCVSDQTPRQSPRKWAYDVDLGLAIARNPHPVEAPLPEDLQLAVSNFFPEPREAAVRRLDALLRGKHRGLALAALKALQVLKEDDSRRVATAAEKSLAACSEQIQVLEEPLHAVAAAAAVGSQPQPDEQGLAAKKDRLEREERERQAAAEKARLERGERERQAAAEKIRLEQEEQERQAPVEKARLEQAKREQQAAAEKPRLEPGEGEEVEEGTETTADTDYRDGIGRLEKADLLGAIDELREAVRLHPSDADAHQALANALNGIGKSSEALNHYDQALQLNPNSADLNFRIGLILFMKGQLKRAIASFRKAVSLQPKDAIYRYNLAVCLEVSGDREAALNECRIAYKMDPRDLDIRRALKRLSEDAPGDLGLPSLSAEVLDLTHTRPSGNNEAQERIVRYASHYQTLADEELLEIDAAREDLMEEAVVALNAELEKRGLGRVADETSGQ